VKIKSVLNSVISALPLDNISPEERLTIAKRIKRGGKKEVDEIAFSPINESKRMDKAENDFKKCEYILESIHNGQHTQAKELFGKLKNQEYFFIYLEGLEFNEHMIEGYRKYFGGEIQSFEINPEGNYDKELEEVAPEGVDAVEPVVEPEMDGCGCEDAVE